MKSLFFNKTLVSNPNFLSVVKLFIIGLLFTFAGSIWIGCSEEPNVSDPPNPQDPIEMTVTVWPQDNAININIDVKPTYTFSHELNGEMPEISVVRQSDGAAINFNLVKVSSKLYRLEFPVPLAEEEVYKRYLYKAIGENGEILPQPLPQVTSFTTSATVIPPLALTAVSPLPGEEIPHTVTELVYSADYDLDPATVGPAYTLMNTTFGMQVLASVAVSGKDISVNVRGLLEQGSAYSVTFNPDIIRGLNGETLLSVFSFSFTTEVVIPPPVFTTPEGFLQTAGDFYDGKYFVGGYGPNDEGFVACFNWVGDSVWFNDFRINGQYTRITRVEVNSTGIYSVALVNPSNPVTYEVWLYRQSLDGEYLDKWKLTHAGSVLSITSSESDIYVLRNDGQADYDIISWFSSNGLQAEIEFSQAFSVSFINGYLYISGSGATFTELFVSKWQANLSDSLWYKEVQHPGVLAITRGYLTNVSDEIWCLGVEYDQQLNSKRILLRYDQNGSLLADLVLPFIDGNTRDLCSDDMFGYMAGSWGLYRVDLNANISQLVPVNVQDAFRADDPAGLDHKIAITDKTNKLKFYNR